MANIYVTEEIREKYPQMEFRGKVIERNGRKLIKAINHTVDLHYYYSFDEDFFWFNDCEIPEWRIN